MASYNPGAVTKKVFFDIEIGGNKAGACAAAGVCFVRGAPPGAAAQQRARAAPDACVPLRPRVAVAPSCTGRVTIGLYGDDVPKTAEK
jgi:hypothetical protein